MHDGTERAYEYLQVSAVNSGTSGKMCRNVTGTYPGLGRSLGRCEKGNPVQRDVSGTGSPGAADEITQKCVRRLGFQSLCTSENETADRANFRMIYEQEQRSQMTFRQLPPALQEQKRKLQQLTAETVKRLEG